VIQPIETSSPSTSIVSTYSWNDSIIWAIYEHNYSKQSARSVTVTGLMIVHARGVAWITH